MKVKITQISSAIGATHVQKANLISLKLGKIGKSAIFSNTDKAFKGRLNIIKHLVSVKELSEWAFLDQTIWD